MAKRKLRKNVKRVAKSHPNIFSIKINNGRIDRHTDEQTSRVIELLALMFYMETAFRAHCPKMEREKAFSAFIGKFPIRGHAPGYRVPKAITETRK